MQWNSWYMFYSSLLFHKGVNFTLKDYFNQLFSLPPNPPYNSTIITEISEFGRIPDHQEGMRRRLMSPKLGRPTHMDRYPSLPLPCNKQSFSGTEAFGLDMHLPFPYPATL
jgi:hypothetical protein